MLPPKPLAVSGTCQTLPGSLLCTFCSSTHSVTHPLPRSEQTALSSRSQFKTPTCGSCPPPHPLYPPPQAGLDASYLELSLPLPWVSGSFPSPPLAVSENECCICICVCERKRDRDKHRSKSNPAGPVVNSLPSYSGDVGSIPGLVTKIPHAMGQLSSQAKTRESPHCNEDLVQ